ncbi:MAG: pilus assembly protein PilX [Burkholderiales bacterium]|jgi:type IV pilus assembly protein PilX|nr:pilus assembly protein PilX [Burkholderiales bacterium]
MNATSTRRPAGARRPEQGFVLVTGLLFLVVVTLLGIALFRSSGLMERVAANTRDKQRAFETAQAALQYGEWWLGQTATATKSACNSTTGKTTSAIHVCSETLSASRDTIAALAWKDNAFTYQQPNLTAAAGGGLNGNDINYQALPGVYIEDLGLMKDGKSELYQLTAYGYGGNADTSSVVRSTFKVTSNTPCLSCLP